MTAGRGIPKLMVVGAHAGDGEVMAGPVVAQHAADGGRATLLHLTLGERGHPSLPGAEYGPQKREEAQAAAAWARCLPAALSTSCACRSPACAAASTSSAQGKGGLPPPPLPAGR